MNDKLNAAIIATLNSIFPFLVLVGAIHWSADTISACVLVVSNLLTTAGLAWALTKKPPVA